MAKDEIALIKTPHKRQTYTTDQILEFQACADPVTGPMYFLDHFFYIQHPTRGRMLYHPFDYQKRLIANGFAREYYGDAKQSWCN